MIYQRRNKMARSQRRSQLLKMSDPAFQIARQPVPIHFVVYFVSGPTKQNGRVQFQGNEV
jgi:hypothetical protein